MKKVYHTDNRTNNGFPILTQLDSIMKLSEKILFQSFNKNPISKDSIIAHHLDHQSKKKIFKLGSTFHHLTTFQTKTKVIKALITAVIIIN
jgi:hypothetical protein